MATMHSLALMNGHLQQVGPPLQASQVAPLFAQDVPQNQPAWSGNNHFYRRVNSGVQPLHTVNVALCNEAYSNRQMAVGQSSAGSHQTVNSQNKKGVHSKDHFLRMLLSHPSLSSTNLGSGNSSFPASRGSQATTHLNHSPPNANSSFAQQDLSFLWKPSVTVNERPSVQKQDGKIVSHLQQSRDHQGSCQNANGGLKIPVSAYTTAAASLSHNPFDLPSTSDSTGAHSRQTVQVAKNQIPRQNSTECRFSQRYHQQYATQLGSPHNKGDATTFSNTNSTNQYENSYFLSKTNALPLNPSVAPQQMQRHTVGADSVVKSLTAGSDGRLPFHNGHHLVNMPRMSNQNIHPMIPALSESYSLNPSQPLPLHSGKSAVESMLRGQHSVNVSSQQNLMPHNNEAQKRSPVESRLSDPHQVMQGPDNVSSQRNNVQPFITNHLDIPEKLELPLSNKQNDSSNHTTTGYSNTRVVAVVQPLSQESWLTSSNTANCDSPANTERGCISSDLAKNTEAAHLREDFPLYLGSPHQIRSSKVMSTDGTILKTSNSAPQNLVQKSELNITVAKDVPKPFEMPVGQTCPKNQISMATSALELSTLPTTPWAVEALTSLILETEKAQKMPGEHLEQRSSVKIIAMFWNKDAYAWLRSYKEGWHKDLLREVWDFCNVHVMQGTVILSQVKQGFEEQLKYYHVLKDEAYSEEPYQSSWLNVNDQLDDIDKEFGFPWTLKQHLYAQTDEVKLASGSPEPVVNEVQSKTFSQKELESLLLTEGKQGSTIETPSTSPGTSSELKGDNSSDSYYSFKIQVLSPEEAKVVYEEVQKNLHQSSDCQEKTVVQSEIPQDYLDVTMKESKMRNRPVDPINQVCCLARLMEMNSGVSTPSFTCLCKDEQSGNEWTDKTPRSDSESSLESKEDIDCQIITLSGPELCKEFYQILDLTDRDDKHCSFSNQEPKIISQISDDSQQIIENTSGNKDEDNISVLPDKITDFEGECAQDLNTRDIIQSNTSVSIAKQGKLEEFYCTEAKVDFQMLEQNKGCGQAWRESADAGELPSATKGRANIRAETVHTTYDMDKTYEKKRKTQSYLHNFFSSLKKSKKCKIPVDLPSKLVPEAQPSEVSEAKTVELVLFGSMQQEKCAISGNGKDYNSSRTSVSYVKNSPPEVLSVTLDPWRNNSSQAADSGKYSVKQRLYEKWRKSIPNISGRRKKLKRSFSAPLFGMSPKREKRSNSSETRISDSNNKHRHSLKRVRSLSNRLRLDEVKRRRYSVTLEQPAEENQNDSRAATPFQENIVLKFSVLPNTFDFKDGRKESTDSVTDEPKLEVGKEQNMDKVAQKSKGIWCQAPEKPYKPLQIPKTFSLFHEYQKKYKEKTKSSTDD